MRPIQNASGAILTDRKELKGGIHTTCSGFGTDHLYGWVRSVKSCFQLFTASGHRLRVRRVLGILSHGIWIARQIGGHKAEKFIP